MDMQSSKLLTWAPRGLEIFLVLLAAWLLAGLFASNPLEKSKHVLVNENSGETSEAFDASLLRGVDLFGEMAVPKDVPAQEKPKNEPVKESRLQIKLIGTVVAGDKSAAMVSAGGSRKQEVFFLHEAIQPNVTLEEVEATAIVVSNRGKRERISIEAGKALVQQSTKPVVKPRRAPQIPIATQVNRKINRQKLNSQMRNFSTLLSQARVSPHFTNGKPDGFTISEIVKGSLYEEIGLLNGDIIKSVNGESVTGAEQAMRMYRELQHATFIDVEVERAGSLQQISYVIQ